MELEAVAAVRSEPARRFQTIYLDKYRLLTLCRDHLKRDGFAKDGNRQGNRSTKDGLISSLSKDMTLSRVIPDMEFCNDFIDHLENKALFLRNPLKNAKLLSMLRSPNVKFGYVDDIIDGVNNYLLMTMKHGSDRMETGELVLFHKLKLKGVSRKNNLHKWDSNRGVDRYEFQDQAGNYYVSHIRPPLWAKVGDGKGNVLSKVPYELKMNDLFTFRGVLGKSFTYMGNKTNVISSIRRAED